MRTHFVGEFGSSDLGRQVLAEKPAAINIKFLKRFPAYCDFIGKAAPMHDERVSGETAPSRGAQNPARTKEQSRNKFPIS